MGRVAAPRRLRRQSDGCVKVAIVCPGAGRIRRGYEAEALDLAARLARRDDLTIKLLLGGNSHAPYEHRVRLLGRFGVIARLVARVTPLYATSVEHYSFGITSLPTLIRLRPDILFVSERVLANFYGAVLHNLGLTTQIVFRNGGDHHPPFRRVDRVLHATEPLCELAIGWPGETAEHVYQPYLFDIEQRMGEPGIGTIQEARKELGIGDGRDVVISVGSIDRSRKRMDYLIREFAKLPATRPHLVILGQVEEETPEIQLLAEKLLGPGTFHFGSVEPERVATYLRASTLFVLPSTREGFGRVYVEALDAGLLCLAHDSGQTRSVLGTQAQYVDMTVPGALARELDAALTDPRTTDQRLRAQRHRYAYDRYSWQVGLAGYLNSLGLSEPPPFSAKLTSDPRTTSF